MKNIFPLLLCVLLAGCKPDPGDPIVAANAFFAQIGEGKVAEAYASTTMAFQMEQPLRVFEAIIRELELARPGTTMEWHVHEFNSEGMKFKGFAACADGVKLPVTLQMSQEKGAWRVLNLSLPRNRQSKREFTVSSIGKGSAFNATNNMEVPPVVVLNGLARETLARFHNALQVGDFEDFHQFVARLWQRQVTPDKLAKQFQPFLDAKESLPDVAGMEPVFDTPPEVTSDGLLVLNGHYPSTPYILHFVLQFVYEAPNWKLFGIDLQLVDPRR